MRLGTLIAVFLIIIGIVGASEPPCLSADKDKYTNIGCAMGRISAGLYYGFQTGFGEWND